MSLGTGIVLFVIGAILAFALNVQVEWIDLHLVGYILMAAGAVGIILGIVMMSRRTCRQMGESSCVFMETLLEKYISSTVKYIG